MSHVLSFFDKGLKDNILISIRYQVHPTTTRDKEDAHIQIIKKIKRRSKTRSNQQRHQPLS